MKFEFSDEATYQEYFGPAHKMVRRSVKEFVDKEIVPNIEDWEEKNEFPRDLYKNAGDVGILGIGYPERTSVWDCVGAASSRDRFNSLLEAAPTSVFFSYLSIPDKRIKEYWRV